MLLATLHVHLHFLHHLKGATFDYVGLAIAACASWLISLGPGEPVIVAAGVFAAKHKLDISPVVFWAWIGAVVGGLAGWLIGMTGGRPLLTAPGPLHSVRLNSIRKGEELFKRREVAAILLTPAWVAGINRSRAILYIPITVVSALLLWAAPLAIGAYFAGPPILDFFDDIGLILTVGLITAGALIVGGELLRRRRRAARASLSD